MAGRSRMLLILRHGWNPESTEKYPLDTLLGAGAVVLRSKRDRIAMGAWLTALEMRAPRNVLIIAMANKLARIAWAVLATGQDYRSVPNALAA
jgi:hypothetical protein